ncbi:MaoC family dehydratase [Parvibaculum sp.]|uniref:MaoC family dehydratase n=1 Tax=Parvibaculum sp. TaxID=2024848 RepID=UPI00320DC7E9
MPKYYWEDFKVGDTLEFGSKHVTREEILEFAREFDPQPFHLDEDAAKKSILGGLCASGWHTTAMLKRMICDAFVRESASVGIPSIEEIRWKKPVYVDDVLSVKRTCIERRTSRSQPGMGLTRFAYEVFNQKQEVVMTMVGWVKYGRRHADEAVEA